MPSMPDTMSLQEWKRALAKEIDLMDFINDGFWQNHVVRSYKLKGTMLEYAREMAEERDKEKSTVFFFDKGELKEFGEEVLKLNQGQKYKAQKKYNSKVKIQFITMEKDNGGYEIEDEGTVRIEYGVEVFGAFDGIDLYRVHHLYGVA